MGVDKFFIHKNNTALLVIDIQDRLFAAMDQESQNNLLKNAGILIETAKIFGVPIVVSEQYRKGLGLTHGQLAEKMKDIEPQEKLCFDCMREEHLEKKLTETGRNTIIITGIETHVCVLQTALSLLKMGKNVVVASDAVASRRTHDWKYALKALVEAGAVIYPTETIAFLLLEKAGTPQFKTLSPLFK